MEVKVGQVWKDNDKRMRERYMRVLRVEGDYAFCKEVNAYATREVRILIRRFKPTSTGWTFVSESPK